MPDLERSTRVAAMLLVLAIAATACASRFDPDAEDRTADDRMSGSIAISGSSTVEPISSLVAEDFRADHPGVEITVDGPGTGDGFELFCQGEIDVADASRAIKDAEVETCASNGIEYTELKVGIDGIAVMTNPANEAVTCLSFTDLYALTGPESRGFSTWADADGLAEELGETAAAPYPDAPLDIFGPGEESGTYDTYVELVLEDLTEERGQEAQTRPDYSSNSDDNVIVQGIGGSDTSLGWVGFAFFEENQDALKAFEIDGGDGCVAPTAETIASGEYPLSRPLFIYVNNARADSSEALQAFVDYYLSDAGKAAVSDVGYVELTDDEWAVTGEAWSSR